MQREITWENVCDIPASEIEAMDNAAGVKWLEAHHERDRRVHANEMVEAVANAISEELGGDHPIDAHYGCALAALTALREPTEAMIDAGAPEAGRAAEHLVKLWRAMIDAALEPVKDRADAA